MWVSIPIFFITTETFATPLTIVLPPCKVQELQKARLKDPVKLEPSLGKLTVDKLQQYMIFVPFKHKVVFLGFFIVL